MHDWVRLGQFWPLLGKLGEDYARLLQIGPVWATLGKPWWGVGGVGRGGRGGDRGAHWPGLRGQDPGTSWAWTRFTREGER